MHFSVTVFHRAKIQPEVLISLHQGIRSEIFDLWQRNGLVMKLGSRYTYPQVLWVIKFRIMHGAHCKCFSLMH